MEKNTEKQKIKVKLTEEQEEKILEEIFDSGIATKTVTIIPNKVTVTLSSLTPEAFFSIEEKVASLKTKSNLALIQSYGLWKLAHSIKSYKALKTIEFNDIEATFNFLQKQSSAIIDKMLFEQQRFETEVAIAVKAENIEKYFFVEGDSQAKPEQSPEE